jgi:outer membrane protein assembly factor BamB
MTEVRHGETAVERPLRLWPGVAIAAIVVVMRYVVPLFAPDLVIDGVLAAAAGAVLMAVWWLFFSRAAWSERLGALAVIVAAVLAVRPFLHKSISTALMGNMFFVYSVPSVVVPAFGAWALFSRRLSKPARWVALAVVMLLACGAWTLLRTDGVTGAAASQLTWRWTKTAEERLLAQGEREPSPVAPAASVAPPPTPAPAVTPLPATDAPRADAAVATKDSPGAPAPAAGERTAAHVEARTRGGDARARVPGSIEWAGFRGASRDATVSNVKLETDWSAKPPVAMWHRPIGPGWSSFAVLGDLLFTQEQRGEEEIVAAYRVSTGEPIWRHRDQVRFWESNGGAGPRGTPTLHDGRVYSLGATGILNVLDAGTGAVVWKRDIAADAGKKVPMWGFSSSPLIYRHLVIVAAAGKLAAYELATGKPRWFGANGGGGYSSPQLATIGGVEQVVFLSGSGATGVDPSDGKALWTYAWEGTPIVQPALTPEGDVLVTSGDSMGGMGMRRLAITREAGSWKVEERWTSNGLKPYFNDFVIHNGYAFGFDGRILSCIDLKDGTRKWKGGRFGQGQMMLLRDQDLLLVVSEEGELALVSATPDKFTEVARFQAIEGKTWNHPVLVRDTLLVRNDQEMAAFRLTLAGR